MDDAYIDDSNILRCQMTHRNVTHAHLFSWIHSHTCGTKKCCLYRWEEITNVFCDMPEYSSENTSLISMLLHESLLLKSCSGNWCFCWKFDYCYAGLEDSSCTLFAAALQTKHGQGESKHTFFLTLDDCQQILYFMSSSYNIFAIPLHLKVSFLSPYVWFLFPRWLWSLAPVKLSTILQYRWDMDYSKIQSTWIDPYIIDMNG